MRRRHDCPLSFRNFSGAGSFPQAMDARAADAWTPLLTLMRKGITLETASRMIGVNPRTGRRRVAAAMDHYGVSTLFALGVAWAADADAAAGG